MSEYTLTHPTDASSNTDNSNINFHTGDITKVEDVSDAIRKVGSSPLSLGELER